MPAVPSLLDEIWTALGGDAGKRPDIEFVGDGALPSAFAVSDLASASIAAAASAVSELIALRHGKAPAVRIDRRLSSLWFQFSMQPLGWTMPPQWDAVAGDYKAGDGWIRLHTNAPHHRAVALNILDASTDRKAVADAVAKWTCDDLETAIVSHGGCAATMRGPADWLAHDQGRAVAAEPLISRKRAGSGDMPAWNVPRTRPLTGIRVLDLTRVLAGPVATRFLAGYGADVLRIDPPSWDEPAIIPEITPGKRCARLDLHKSDDRKIFERLLTECDVFVHGYRPDALDRLGFGVDRRRTLNPTLVDISLDAYGWTGPWRARRGFDSLVQMSTGIAEAGMRHFAKDEPAPLPVQALDHAAGYLMAASAVRGLSERLASGAGNQARTSLARVATLLLHDPTVSNEPDFAPRADADFGGIVEHTEWGDLRRLHPPAAISDAPMRWDRPAERLGASAAVWSTR